MILAIILLLASPILILVGIHVAKELISKQKLKFYTNQGIKTVYIPIAGAYKHFYPKVKKRAKPLASVVEYAAKLKEEDNGKGLIATNTYDGINPTLYLLNKEMIGEFLLKEVNNYVRRSPFPSYVDYMFFYFGGQEALFEKSIFSKFFGYDNIKSLLPKIQKIFMRRFEELKVHWKDCDASEWKSIDIAPLMHTMFNDVVHIVIFGVEDPEKVPKIEGLAFSHAIEKWVSDLYIIMKKPMHALTFGLSTRYGFTKEARDLNHLQTQIEKQSMMMIKQRELEKPNKTLNLIDMMIEWNRKCDAEGNPQKKLSYKVMVGNMLFFYIAGTDTSRATSSSCLHMLG